MPVTKNDLSRFQEFAEGQLASGSPGSPESLEQLFDLWVLANPSPEQIATDLAAIQRGVADADAGRFKSVEQAFEQVRKQLIAKQ